MGAECSRCGRDIYDECGYCEVVDERDRYRAALEEIAAEIDHPEVPGEALAYSAQQALRQEEKP